MSIRIFKHYIQVPLLLLGMLEAMIFIAAVYAGAYLRFLDDPAVISDRIGPLLPRGLVFAAIMVLSLLSMGLYHARVRLRTLGIILRVVAGFALGGMALALLFYVVPSLHVGRGALALAFIVSFLLVATLRAAFFQSMDESRFRRHVLIYGAGAKAASITQLRRRADQRGFLIVGFVRAGKDEIAVDPARVVDVGDSLIECARAHEVDEIVVAIDDRRRGLPVQGLLDCKLGGIDVIDALTFVERETGTVQLDLLYPSWIIFSDGFANTALRNYTKRAFDIVFALLLLVPALPLMLLTACAILLEDGLGKPVLYRQIRVGHEGRPFRLLKFRSMHVDAEDDGRAVWAQPNDSRITRVGSIIRRYRIDELSQILNVLRGDMSFVGPRPERPEFVAALSGRIPYYRERHCVKPGITGWAQVCYQYGATEEDAAQKLQFDLYYVKNHSLIFDLLIILQTAEVVLWKQGAR